ncbi:uncharacterized protein LOC143837259 isoform X1 [Paroedura picta]|uniref:uncharacterized protein LOC143837259 isoform X1 n=2 Tax=Paroedura picta TaxID=143630 RepID=UPI004055ACCC
MREGLLGRAAAAARPAGHASGAMDLVAGMEVGAEIEVTEDGTLEELPLHLENAKNCLSWESLDLSSSDDDGEAYLTFCLPVRRPPRPAARLPPQRLPPAPSAIRAPAFEKRVPPLFPCPVRLTAPPSPVIPAFSAYQCHKCLQVFMEEWHYAQHLQDHAQEEAQQQAALPAQPRPHSPPRKLRCLECGKRFLHPEHFARHTKWHLKLVRKGIRVCRKKGSRRAEQVSYIYKPLGTVDGNQAGACPSLPVAAENPKQAKSLQVAKPHRAGKRKGVRPLKSLPPEAVQGEALPAPTYLENAMTILDGEFGVGFLHPWQKKQEAVLEGQVVGGLFQPAVVSAENQIIILDEEEAEARPGGPEQHYAEVQAALFDNQTSTVRPLFFRTEEQAPLLDPPVNMGSFQLGGGKEPATLTSGWLGQNPCTLFRTVLLQSDEPAALLDGPAEANPLQQVIIKTSEVSPALLVDTEPHFSTLDSATLQFVPVHSEPQFIAVNSLAVDHTDLPEEGDKAWEAQTTAFQFPSYLPNVYQQNKPSSPSAASCPSPKGSLVVRLVPCASGEHPEVLDLEYDTGGGIPVASEPWEASVGTGQESYTTEEAVEDNFIIVEVEGDEGGQGLAANRTCGSPRTQPSPRVIRAVDRNHVWRFKCPDCGVRYSRVSQLRSHQKGPKRRGRSYLCECGASFRGLLHLLRHQLLHLAEALFICATCGKSLKGHQGLARHSTCHPGSARFGCTCGISFQRLSRYLWHHVKSQRPGLRVYTLSGFLSSG